MFASSPLPPPKFCLGAGEALAGLIDGNTSLTDLDLSDNHLGGEQASFEGWVLSAMTSTGRS